MLQGLAGRRAGGNQFDSFQHFNVPNGSSATFRSDGSQVNNVLARVTGMAPSRIGGLLKSEWAGAHFFFMNPLHPPLRPPHESGD